MKRKIRTRALTALLALLLLLPLCACGATLTLATGRAYEAGTEDGGTYANAFTGIGCTLGEGWAFAENAQLDMSAAAGDQTATMTVMLEKRGVISSAFSGAEKYLDASVDTLRETYESMGMTGLTITRGQTVFAGTRQESLRMDATYDGQPFCEDIIAVPCGQYMAIYSFGCRGEDRLAELEGWFYTLGA